MGSFRQIKVTVTGFGKPTVRTRNGYYATPTARLDRAIDHTRSAAHGSPLILAVNSWARTEA